MRNNIYFRRELIIKDMEIMDMDDVLQIGFLNFGEVIVYINDLRLDPVPDPVKYNIANVILWMPQNENEKDSSRYRVRFEQSDNPSLVRELTVMYKIYKR